MFLSRLLGRKRHHYMLMTHDLVCFQTTKSSQNAYSAAGFETKVSASRSLNHRDK